MAVVVEKKDPNFLPSAPAAFIIWLPSINHESVKNKFLGKEALLDY